MPIRISDYWQQFVFSGNNIYKSKKCKFYTTHNSVIIDCDEIKRVEKRSEPINDFIVLEKSDSFHVGIVEFKGKNPDIRHAIVQLYSGKNIAEKIIKDSRIKQKPEMYMILVSPNRPHSRSIMLSMKKRGLKTGIQFKTARCCESFSSVRKSPPRARSHSVLYRRTTYH